MVTLGLHEHQDRDSKGIVWSMPLAHLRYYGGAVPSQRTLGFKNSKVSFDQIVLVAMGSAMSRWPNALKDLEIAMRFFIAIADRGNYNTEHQLPLPVWPHLFANQARRVLDSDKTGRHEMVRLIALGWRRYGIFLAANKDHPDPLFGLSKPGRLLNLLRLPDQEIATIRKMVPLFPVKLEGAFIRYVHDNRDQFRMIEYASIDPAVKNPSQNSLSIRHRWIMMPRTDFSDYWMSLVLDRATYIKTHLREPCGLLEFDELFREIDTTPGAAPRIFPCGTRKRHGFWEDLEERCSVNLAQRHCISLLKDDHDLLENLVGLYRGRYELCLGEADSRVQVYNQRQTDDN